MKQGAPIPQRDWKRVRTVLFAVVLIGLLSGSFILQRSAGNDEVKSVWYFDLNTRTLFVGPYASAPSIPAPSGAYNAADGEELDHEAGVGAMVVRPKSGGDPRVIYLQRYTKDGKVHRQRELAGDLPNADEGPAGTSNMVIAVPPTDNQVPRWYSPGSAPGKAILADYGKLMRSGEVEFYLPGD